MDYSEKFGFRWISLFNLVGSFLLDHVCLLGLHLRENIKRGVYVDGITEKPVATAKEAFDVSTLVTTAFLCSNDCKEYVAHTLINSVDALVQYDMIVVILFTNTCSSTSHYLVNPDDAV